MDPQLKTLERQSFAAGETILREGEPGTRAYVVESGEVEIWRADDGGRDRLGVVGEDGIFGEMALIDNQPRMASATALSDLTCFVVSEEVFRTKLAEADPFLVGLLRILVNNIRSLTAHHEVVEASPGAVGGEGTDPA